METDDEARRNGIAESDDESGRPRRATFLARSASVPEPPADSDDDHYDDDALANAMADEAVRLGLTGAISVVPPKPAAAPAAPPTPLVPPAPAPSPFAPPTPGSLVDLPAPTVPPASFETESPVPSAFVQPFAPPVGPVFPAGGPSEGEHDDAPSAPVVAAQPPVTAEGALPTRRSIRDAEQARTRKENARRADQRGTGAPPAHPEPPALPLPEAAPEAAPEATAAPAAPAPVAPEVPPSPDFFPAPSIPESSGVVGEASAEATAVERHSEPTAIDHVASLFDTGEVATVGEPPIYDLVEPAGRSASIATVFPFALASDAQPGEPVGPPVVEAPSAPARSAEPDDAPVEATVVHQRRAAADRFAADDELLPRSTNNPWLLSTASAVVEVAAGPESMFVPEASGAEPTPLDRRVGRASRLFWLWFAANSSVVSLAFGGALFSLGMSLRQAIVAAFVGVAISFLPLGLGTLAGKWSGQPVMIVSRATFGLVGNVVPAGLALVTRLFWGAVLLWMLAASTARILIGSKGGGPLSELQLTVIVMAVGFLLALVVAFFGYSLFARIQLVLSIVSGALIVALVAVTWHTVDFSRALTVGDGPVILVVTGVVLVFSFVGLVWANSSGDLARYQGAETSGGASMLWASFGATLPAFLLVAYGAVLAASNPATATGLSNTPLDTVAALLPGWYPIPLILATGLSLLSGVILSIYSGGFALAAVGVRVSRVWATVIVGALVFAVAIALGFTVSSVVTVFRDIATTIAVPVAAWTGIFGAEMIIRRRRFDSESLLTRGGVYPDVNWVNLSMLVVGSVIGLGFTTATIAGLGWEGYLFRAIGVPLGSDLAGTDVGVLIALLLGLLTPLAAGITTIRRQERGRA